MRNISSIAIIILISILISCHKNTRIQDLIDEIDQEQKNNEPELDSKMYPSKNSGDSLYEDNIDEEYIDDYDTEDPIITEEEIDKPDISKIQRSRETQSQNNQIDLGDSIPPEIPKNSNDSSVVPYTQNFYSEDTEKSENNELAFYYDTDTDTYPEINENEDWVDDNIDFLYRWEEEDLEKELPNIIDEKKKIYLNTDSHNRFSMLFDFRNFDITNGTEELKWDDQLPKTVMEISNIDSCQINHEFLQLNFHPDEYEEVPEPLYIVIKRVAKLYKEAREKQWTNHDRLKLGNRIEEFEGDVLNNGTEKISIDEFIWVMRNSERINDKISQVVAANSITGITTQKVKWQIYRAFINIEKAVNKGNLDPATLAMSYLVPALGLAHCHGRTIGALVHIAQIFSDRSMKLYTIPGQIYWVVTKFKEECFDKAVLLFWKEYDSSNMPNGGSDVHYKNWAKTFFSDIIKIPGQDISRIDTSAPTYRPYGTRDISKGELELKFMQLFKSVFTPEEIVNLIISKLETQDRSNSGIEATKFLDWMKNRGIEYQDIYADDLFTKLKKSCIIGMLVVIGILDLTDEPIINTNINTTEMKNNELSHEEDAIEEVLHGFHPNIYDIIERIQQITSEN